jgi:hypothetical protein
MRKTRDIEHWRKIQEWERKHPKLIAAILKQSSPHVRSIVQYHDVKAEYGA